MERDRAMALLGRLHAAQNHFYGGGEATALREVLTDDIAWRVPGRNAIAGHYRGIDEVIGYFRKRREFADLSFRMRSGDVLTGDGDRIASLTDGSAVISGRQRTWSTVGLYQVRDERIAACRLLPLAPEEFDDIWADRKPGAMADPVSVSRQRVRPRHCDAQGMLHASRYYEYFEDAFLDWLAEHVGGYTRLRSAGADLVIVASGCEHHSAARLDDLLSIEVRPTDVGRTSFSVSFTVQRPGEAVLAVGRTTYVAVSVDGAVPLPEVLRTAMHL